MPLPLPILTDKIKVISFSKEYETDIITLFHACGDFNYRHRWLEGVKKVEEVNHYLPRVGMKCRCVLENGEAIIYSSSYSYSSEKIEFSETDEQKKSSTYYTLEKKGDKKTKLTLDIYQQKKPADQIPGNIEEKKKIQEIYNKSLINLTELVKEIKLPS